MAPRENNSKRSYNDAGQAKLVAEHRKLHNTLQKFTSLAQNNPTSDTAAVLALLGDAQTSSKALHEVVRQNIDPVWYNEHQTANSTAVAHKTFNVPELLGLILLNLKAPDLLNLQRVSRQFFDATQDSHGLQRILGLRSASYFSVPLVREGEARLKGLSVSVRPVRRAPDYRGVFASHGRSTLWSKVEPSTAVRLSVWLNHPLPRIRSRIRQMLVCQPPITSMTVNLLDKTHGPFSPNDGRLKGTNATVENLDGIKIGDLYDSAYNKLETDAKEPQALAVLFYSDVQLHNDDPTQVREKGWNHGV